MDASILITVLVVLGVLLAAQVPVAFTLLIAGTVGIFLLEGMELAVSILARVPFTSTGDYSLLVIPMFILMGTIAQYGDLASGIFRLASRVLARIPGGLALSALAASASFAAVTGSSVAT